jgi:hypothetical protein
MWFLRIAEAVFFVAGAFLFSSPSGPPRGSASIGWPQTSGRVLRSYVSVDTGMEGGEGNTPRVEYQYAVQGNTYQGTRIRFGQTGTWTGAQAERVIAPFSPDSTIAVFFDPQKPPDAVLVAGISWGNLGIALAGLVFLAMTYGLYIHGN